MHAEQAAAGGYIARWRPSSVSPQATFARDVIARTRPEGRERAKNLLWAAGKLADWAIPLGLEPVPEVLLHPSAVERFTRCAPGQSGVARRTLRTNLRFIGRRAVPHLYPADLLLHRERAKAPGSPAEIGGYLALADAQPTRERRMRAASCPSRSCWPSGTRRPHRTENATREHHGAVGTLGGARTAAARWARWTGAASVDWRIWVRQL